MQLVLQTNFNSHKRRAVKVLMHTPMQVPEVVLNPQINLNGCKRERGKIFVWMQVQVTVHVLNPQSNLNGHMRGISEGPHAQTRQKLC